MDKAWSRHTVSPASWLISLPDACVSELDAVVATLRARPAPLEALAPEQFALGACAAVMAQVREKLEHEVGLAVVDRFPVERWEIDENRAIAWLLARMLGQVVAQKWNGTRIYDVKDTGRTLEYGVRRSVTNLDLPFHTDGGWLWKPPAFVGLYCLQSGQEGGDSRFVSLVTVHDELAQRHPELLARLYRPFPWNRQAEHAEGDRPFARQPVFEHDGGALIGRYFEDYVVSGSEMAGEPLDDEARAAFAAMRSIVNDPEHWVEFRIETGQLQYLNNREFAHSRTAFTDTARGPQRHMLRLWNRDEGTPHLEGAL